MTKAGRLVRIIRRGSGSVVTWRRTCISAGRDRYRDALIREVLAFGGKSRRREIGARRGLPFAPRSPRCGHHALRFPEAPSD
jgi:hypothetical protein